MLTLLRRRIAPFSLALLASSAAAAGPPFTLAYRYHLPTQPALQPGAVSVIARDFTFDGRTDVVVALRDMPLTMFIAQTYDRGGFLPRPLPVFQNYASPAFDRQLISAGAVGSNGFVNDIIYPDSEHSLRRVQRVGGLAGYAAQYEKIDLPPYNGAVGRIANLVAGDFNGDQRTDVAIVDVADDLTRDHRTTGVVAWGRVGMPAVDRGLPTVADPYFITAADFVDDAAHRPDLLVASSTDKIGLTTYDAATQRFVLRQTLTVPDGGYMESLAAGDLNGDGKPDALAIYRKLTDGYGSTVIENRGADGLALGPTFSLGSAMTQCIGDFNADGTPDILLDGRLLMLGRGNYAYDATPQVMPDTTYGVACADFNGDGLRDYAVAMNASDSTFELRIYQYREDWDRIFASGFQP